MDNDTYITMPPANEAILKEEASTESDLSSANNLAIYSPFRVDVEKLSGNEIDWRDFLIKVGASSEKIQDILIGTETIDFLADLSEGFSLTESQSQELSRILRDVLLADLFWGDFSNTMSSRLQIDANTANQIIRMVSDELLAPALEEIKTMQKSKFGDRITQARHEQLSPGAPPPAPAPHRPVGFVRPNETVQQSNIVDLRNREN